MMNQEIKTRKSRSKKFVKTESGYHKSAIKILDEWLGGILE
jgi:hypothetical protein